MNPRKRIKIIASSCGVLLLALVLLFLASLFLPAPFPVEEYSKSRTGAARFKELPMNRIDADSYLLGFGKHAGKKTRVTRFIFGNDAWFVFTDDARVFAMAPCESGAESCPFESWNWSRDPHEFPYFDKKYPSSCP